MLRIKRHRYKPAMEGLEDRLVLSGYSPTQLKTAYGFNALGFTASNGKVVPADGTGETIAIVVAFHDPYLAQDLHTFDARYNLPDPTLNQVNLAGGSTDNGWAGEETLDVEWAHAMAPGATILVVESATDNTTDLLAAVNVARNTPGVVAVSMSWGGPELSNETLYDATYFTTPAGHTGVTFVTASGDNGASGGAEWPASSPNVLAVGGTTLSINANGTYGGETAWNGSGVGVSRYENEPAYQSRLQSTGKRVVPDVGFLADPNTGVDVYTTNPSDGSASWSTVGGTSLGSPAWAGIVAIIDQGLNLAGTPSYDGATQMIPKLYAVASPQSFQAVANSLVQVHTGNGGFRHGGGLTVTVSDTGLGTPVVRSLAAAINRNTTTISPPPPPPSVAVATVEVQKLYQIILNRAPDSRGLAASVNAIESGIPVAQIASGLFHSAEYATNLVIQAYQTDLGRTPSSTEIANAVGAIQKGLTPLGFHAILLSSNEFNIQHASNSSFTQAVYRDVLGRAATPSDIANVSAALNSGLSRSQFIRNLQVSAEADINTINSLYQAYLGRKADTGAIDSCLAQFMAGTLDATSLAIALSGSAEFQSKA